MNKILIWFFSNDILKIILKKKPLKSWTNNNQTINNNLCTHGLENELKVLFFHPEPFISLKLNLPAVIRQKWIPCGSFCPVMCFYCEILKQFRPHICRIKPELVFVGKIVILKGKYRVFSACLVRQFIELWCSFSFLLSKLGNFQFWV